MPAKKQKGAPWRVVGGGGGVPTVKLALELGQDKGNSLGGSGGGGDNVESSSTGPTQVPVGCIEQPLVTSV